MNNKVTSSGHHRSPTRRWPWLGAPLLIAVAAAFFVGQPACTENSCTPSNGDDTEPGPAFECSAGEVCYLGKCLDTCSAGAELSEVCTSDDDCSGARPNCVRARCSACSELETCVPTLNVCQPVSDVIPPEELTRPESGPQAVPRPLDAGFEPGGIRRPLRDAGVAEQPQDREVTRVALIELGREIDYGMSPPVEIPVTIVRSFNTQINAGTGLKWRLDATPPRVEEDFPDPAVDPTAPPGTVDDFCRVRKLEPGVGMAGETPTPASLGDILMSNPTDFPNSITPELIARWNGTNNRYDITPGALTPSFLTFSTTAPPPPDTNGPHFVFVSGGSVNSVVSASWPQTSDFGHHVPFELVPTDGTRDAMLAQYQVANPAAQDLAFRYDRIESGNDSFESVLVRVIGSRTELVCDQQEGADRGGDIRVRAGILNAFRAAEGITAATTYPLYFERASRKLLQPSSPEDQLVLITVRIRHSHRTSITFE